MTMAEIVASQELKLLIDDVLASADGCASCMFEVVGDHLCSHDDSECPYQTSMGVVRRLEHVTKILEGEGSDDD